MVVYVQWKSTIFNHQMLYFGRVSSDAAACGDAGCRESQGTGTSADGRWPDTRCQGWYKALEKLTITHHSIFLKGPLSE